jgi:hypothetical protein
MSDGHLSIENDMAPATEVYGGIPYDDFPDRRGQTLWDFRTSEYQANRHVESQTPVPAREEDGRMV